MNFGQPPPNGQQPPVFTQGFSSFTKKTRWDENIRFFEFPANKWVQVRFYGPLFTIAQHWFKSKTGTRFPKICLAYNSDTRSFDHKDRCPVEAEFDPKNHPDQRIKDLSPRQTVYSHLIPRELQTVHQNDPNFIPLVPVRMPITLALLISNLKGLNKHTINGITYEVDATDPNYGCDIMICYNPNAPSPQQAYSVAPSTQCKLNDREQAYSQSFYDWKNIIEYPNAADVKEALKSYMGDNGIVSDSSAGTAPSMPMPSFQPSVSTYQTGGGFPPPPSAPQMPAFTPPPPQYQQQQAPMPAFTPPPPQYQQQQAPPPMPAFAEAPQMPAFTPPQYQQQQAPPQMAPPQMPAFTPPQYQQQQAPPQMAPPQMQQAAPPQMPAFTPPQMSAPPAMDVNESFPQQGLQNFPLAGKPNGVSPAEFQSVIQEYSSRLDRAVPLKAGANQLAGIQVLKCYGQYQADEHCIRCPIRKYCISGG